MGLHFKVILLAFGGILLFFGCSSKEYFKPVVINGNREFNGKLPSKMISTSKYGATLKNRQILTQNLDFTLQKDEIFLGYSSGYYLASKHCNTLLIYGQDKSLKASLNIPSCPVSASIQGDQIALVGNDNTAYLYEISTQKELLSKKSNSAIAVNSILQAPVFFESYVFFPTLDGSVIVANLKTLEVEKSLIIDSATFFNNVIFLEVQKDLVLTSTAKRILSIYQGKTYTLEEEIRDIKIHQNKIYLSTLDGQIKELDFTLKLLRSLKFQFASIPLLSISQGKIYAIEDGSGFLIEVDLANFTPSIYKLSLSRGGNIFSNKNRIYYQDRYLEF